MSGLQDYFGDTAQPAFPQYGTMVGDPVSQWAPYNPWGNISNSPLVQFGAQLAGTYIGNATGMTPMGFNQSGNIYTMMREQTLSRDYFKGMEQAANYDVSRVTGIVAGTLQAAGRNMDPSTADGLENRRKIENWARLGSGFLPFTNPGAWNKLTGGASPMTLYAGMALNGQLTIDPVTGMRGVTADSAKVMSTGLWENYYSDQSNWRQKTGGLDSLEMRDLHGELVRRGMMQTPSSLRERVTGGLRAMTDQAVRNTMREENIGGSRTWEDAYRRAGIDTSVGLDKLNDTQLQALAGDEGVQFGMRADATGRVKQTLDKYKGVASAVKELFGKQNAPMAEIMNILEGLTNNTLSQQDPTRLEMTVRNMMGIAKSAHIGMAQIGQMMGTANAMTSRAGLNEAFAPSVVESAMSFRGAYDSVGAAPAWGLKSADELMQMEMSRTTRAASSTLANRVGAVMRLADRGGKMSGLAARLVDNVNRGTLSSMTELTSMSATDFYAQIAAGTGMSVADIRAEIENSGFANQEAILKYGLATPISRMGATELAQKVLSSPGGIMTNTLTRRIREMTGTSGRDTIAMGQELAQVSSAALLTLSRNDDKTFKDAVSRNSAIAAEQRKFIKERAAAGDSKYAGLEKRLAGLDDPNTDEDESTMWLMQNAEQMYNTADTAVQRSTGDNLVNLLSLDRQDVAAAADRERARVELLSSIGSIRAGELEPSVIKRLTQAMAKAGDPNANDYEKTLSAIIGAGVGLMPNSEVVGKLTSAMRQITAANPELEADRLALANLGPEGPNDSPSRREKRRMLQERITNRTDAIKEAQQVIVSTYEQNPALKEELDRQLKQSEELKKAADDAGLAPDGTAKGGAGAAAAAAGGTVFNNLTISAPEITISIKHMELPAEAKPGGPNSTEVVG